MSQSDGWSIAATLFGAGIAYFIGGKYAAYGSIIISVLIAAYLLATRKPKAAPVAVSQSQQANPSMTANPEMKQEANPRIENSPNISPTIIGALHLPAPLPTPKPERRPDVEVLEARQVNLEEITSIHDTLLGFNISNDRNNPEAFILTIKNKADKQGEGVYIHDIRASLSYRDKQGKELLHVSDACWVGRMADTSIRVEDRRSIILFAAKDNVPMVLYLKEQQGYSEIDGYEFPKESDSLEITLVWQGKLLLADTYDLLDDPPFVRLRKKE